MEKRIKSEDMGRNSNLKKIVITGPESTGKTLLSEALAKTLNAKLIPEYARSYVENLGRPYNYNDLELIARHQIKEEASFSETTFEGLLLMDTWLIMTKVWFDVVYGSSPDWLDKYLTSADIDLFMVCSPDIPWIADPVRENGGEMRLKLFEKYCKEIKQRGFLFEIVEGFGEIRLNNAIQILKTHQIC
jgi:NadR type nicotinamide-nucleotide adenylyltransferase